MRESRTPALNIATPEDMRRLGGALGAALSMHADRALLIGIAGELGSGKTVFVSGVLRQLGISGPVRSPTYTLIEPYEFAGRPIYHLDLYRLADPREVESLGVRDLLAANGVLLVEWPERGAGALPPADLHICISYASPHEGRRVTIQGNGPVGEALANALRNAVNVE